MERKLLQSLSGNAIQVFNDVSKDLKSLSEFLDVSLRQGSCIRNKSVGMAVCMDNCFHSFILGTASLRYRHLHPNTATYWPTRQRYILFVCMYVCLYVCMYVCMCVCGEYVYAV